MKHTPGPWTATRWRVCAEEPFRYITDTANNKASRTEENEANARLIAAAPELLAALKGMVEHLLDDRSDGRDEENALSSAMGAIAKAEGKS